MIHHTAVSYTKNSDQFNANNNYHKAQWNFKSSLGYYLGYNYEIAKNGRVSQARKDGETTAACYQNNMNDGRAIHIALDGNFDSEKPTPEQIYALRDLMRKLVSQYGIKESDIIFHRDHAAKTCPGNNVEIGFIRSLAFPVPTPNIIPEPAIVPGIPTSVNTEKEDIKREIALLLSKISSLIEKI